MATLAQRREADKAEQRAAEREQTWAPIIEALRKRDGARAAAMIRQAGEEREGLGNAMLWRAHDWLETAFGRFSGEGDALANALWFLAERDAWAAGDPKPCAIEPFGVHAVPALVALVAAWHDQGKPKFGGRPWDHTATVGAPQANLEAVGVAS